MSTKNANVGHSVFQRLRNLAKANNEDFNFILSRYAMERFLYRLSISSHATRFILKGSSLFLVWEGKSYRVTRDADLLGFGSPDLTELQDVFASVSEAVVEDDGMEFLPKSLKVVEIREGNEYDGVRVTLVGLLNNAKIPIQIDIGFGDAVTPAPDEIEYPTLLDGRPPKLKAYPRYTVVAEKMEAMVKLGLANSRMKDFYDVWLLSRLYSFDGQILAQALKNTFDRRSTSLPVTVPTALSPAFSEDSQKLVQWTAFARKAKSKIEVLEFSEVIEEITAFVMPVLESLQMEAAFEQRWTPGDGWQSVRS
jgi:predicted nucleotidyltransferase component of viral defense system